MDSHRCISCTGAQLPDVVPWVKFSSIAWTHDNKGFFYSRYPSVDGLATAVADGEDAAAAKHAGTEVDKNQNHMVCAVHCYAALRDRILGGRLQMILR
jgi:hypothetical protein